MSEPIPEAIPTSQDPRSKRPTKKRALTPNGQQAADVEALFANPEREIVFPDGSASSSRAKQLAPPPEIVQNVQGSSAGAGSGEFHVYKASRRREYERLRMMDEETRKEKDNADFERQRDERQRKDDDRTRKNREKRDKAKKRKAKAKLDEPTAASTKDEPGIHKRKGPRPIASTDDKGNDEEAQETGTGTVDAEAEAAEETGITIHDDD